MKVMVLTCSTGEGHNSAARAIKEAFEAGGGACDIVDSLGLVSKKASLFVSSWHTRIYRHMPKMFAAGYSYTERHPAILTKKKWDRPYISPGVDKLYRMLHKGGYDAILCVHAFCATTVSKMRGKYGHTLPAYFVATDYTCSPSVAQSDMDLFFIPHEGLAAEFEAGGVPRHKLVPLGIPVRQIFYAPVEKARAKALLGLPPQKRHVLLMCGSMGCGPMEALALALSDSLPEDAILSVACGTNEKLLRALEKHGRQNLRLLGFTDKIPLLMDSAEIFLTKPGGISISEAGAKGLPMLLIHAVGGCESRNLRYFWDRNWAQTAEGPKGIAQRCLEMLADPEGLQRQSAALRAAFCGNAALDIFARLGGLCAPPHSDISSKRALP